MTKRSALRTWLREQRAQDHELWLKQGGEPLPQRPLGVLLGATERTMWFCTCPVFNCEHRQRETARMLLAGGSPL